MRAVTSLSCEGPVYTSVAKPSILGRNLVGKIGNEDRVVLGHYQANVIVVMPSHSDSNLI